MRKNRVIEQNRCYHLVSRLAHRAFFLDDEEKDRAVALMRRVEAGVQASMSYCINRAVSISSDPFDPLLLPPEKYENLQVRVCGWNVRWNDMTRKEQDAYIRRAENIMR